MKLAVIGSRNIHTVHIEKYVPSATTEIVSGGARGIDTCAAEYAKNNHLKLTVFLPDYARYGRAAPLKRNDQIANYADAAIAFWDGQSRGTHYTIQQFQKCGKDVQVILPSQENR